VVYAPAEVRGLPEPDGPAVVHLKIVPRGKLAFSTLAFQVERLELLQGLPLGDEVGFTAERRAQGNTLTRIVKLAPCVRFRSVQPSSATVNEGCLAPEAGQGVICASASRTAAMSVGRTSRATS
jgi:hypothetical protein